MEVAAGAGAGRPVGNVWIGTCSWTDRTLLASGAFYPREARSAEARLRHYASVFPLVEVDATYYAPPSAAMARLWVERTPPGFCMNVKAYGLLTHHPVAVKTLPPEVQALLPAAAAAKPRIYLEAVPPAGREALWRLHDEALRPLAAAGKLGAVLFQFPPWFRATRGNAERLRALRDRLPWRIAVEFRGGGWMDEERRPRTLALLEECGLSYVAVDEPQGFASSTPPVVAATAPLAMLRLHGRNAANWERRGISAAERFDYLYPEAELRGLLPRVQELARRAERVHVLFNNCWADHAVRNARQMAGLLAQEAAS